MIKVFFILLTTLFFAFPSDAQVYSQLYSGKQEMFLEAESFHLFEEYKEALPLYIELLKDQPGNSFLNYRAGTCFLNIPGQKDNAIKYLEKAVEDIDSRNRRATYRTIKAPPDALFYLGNAYHINYQFDKALDVYSRFREKMDPSVYDIEVIEEHIKASKNASESIRNPMFFKEINLGEKINSGFPETNPAVSGNEKMMVFTRRLPFYDAVFFSEKADEGEWSWPVEITPNIGSDGDCYPVSLSWDGSELYLYKSDDLVGNIYLSRFTEGEWTMIEKLNDNINTSYWESHACTSRDGNTLYFTSNRPGGYGGLDIYFSLKDENGEWGPAINIGPEINTPYNENTPFISENGNILYFSSYGHYNIGGYDILYSSRLDEGDWSEPLNAGYGINTPDDDIFYNPLRNGNFAYFSKFSNEGFGETDIYRYEIFSESHPRKFLLKGKMARMDGLHTGGSAKIHIVEPVSGDTIHTSRPAQKTGEYEIMIEAGQWQVIFSEEGHDDVIKNLNVRPNRKEDELSVDVTLERTEPELPEITKVITDRIILPEKTDHQMTLGIKQHHYRVSEDEKIVIDMELENNTILEVDRYLDSTLTDTEKINVDRKRFGYEFTPAPGENILRFRYTGKEGEYITDEVVIGFHPPEQEEPVPDTTYESGSESIEKPDTKDKTPSGEREGEGEKEGEKEETSTKGIKTPVLWILILAIILLAVFYYKERIYRNNNRD